LQERKEATFHKRQKDSMRRVYVANWWQADRVHKGWMMKPEYILTLVLMAITVFFTIAAIVLMFQ
jgi:hypothetical protein